MLAHMGTDIGAVRRDIDRAIEGQTLCSVFAAPVARLGDAEALVGRAGGEDAAVVERSIASEVRAVALGLRALGVAPRQLRRVPVAQPARAPDRRPRRWCTLGGTPVGLYNTLAPEQISYIANHCDAKVAVVEDAALLARFRRDELPGCARGAARGRERRSVGDRRWTGCSRSAATRTRAIRTRSTDCGSAVDARRHGHADLHVGDDRPAQGRDRHPSQRAVGSRVGAPRESHERRDRHGDQLPAARARGGSRARRTTTSLVTGHTIVFCPDVAQLFAALLEVRPTMFGGVPRIWEKLHAGLTSGIAQRARRAAQAARCSARSRSRAPWSRSSSAASRCPPSCAQQRAAAEPMFAAIRAQDRARSGAP